MLLPRKSAAKEPRKILSAQILWFFFRPEYPTLVDAYYQPQQQYETALQS